MGRKSKLSDDQWADLFRRKAEGESNRALADVFKISEASIREKEAKIGKTADVQQVAQMIVGAERAREDAIAALTALPVSAQVSAQNLAAKLRSISDSLASGAELGAKNFHRLSSLANTALQKVDDEDPASTEGHLKAVAVLTKMANDAAITPIGLLAANKDTVKRLNEQEDPVLPVRVTVQVEDAGVAEPAA